MIRARTSAVVATATALLALSLGGGAVAAEDPGGEHPDAIYTMLGRGYAVIFGYPLDEVPGGDDGGEEEGDSSQSEEPLPDQTCPEDQRGVAQDIQERLDRLHSRELSELGEEDSDTPTPRGQPIKFDFGLADTSLRSDPGSHAIASFFYVDLGGPQDPNTSAESDGYASGHARFQERCSQPYSSNQGNANQVHVITEAIEGPYAYAYHHAQNPRLPGGVSLRESITVAEMDGRSNPVWGRITSIAQGVAVGSITADEVVTVLDYSSDGTAEGTVVRGATDVVGLEIAGTPLDVSPGAPPVSAGNLVVGVAAPETRRLEDGSLEITAGGLYVAGEFPNPLGLQAKQAVFIGGAWLDTVVSSFPSFEFEPVAAAPTQAPPPDEGDGLAMTPWFDEPASTGAQPPTLASTQSPSAPGAEDAEPAVAAPVLGATSRYGVYQAPTQVTGPLLVVFLLLASLGMSSFVWARHTYPEIRAALGTPLFRWLDYSYRAFMRG